MMRSLPVRPPEGSANSGDSVFGICVCEPSFKKTGVEWGTSFSYPGPWKDMRIFTFK